SFAHLAASLQFPALPPDRLRPRIRVSGENASSPTQVQARLTVSSARASGSSGFPPNRRNTHMANTFGSQSSLRVGDRDYTIFRLAAGEKEFPRAARLPYSLKILLENLLRTEDGQVVRPEDVRALAGWQATADPHREIAFTPSRVLLQDFTGVPAIVDL